jgi:hypothetical protein
MVAQIIADPQAELSSQADMPDRCKLAAELGAKIGMRD